MSARVVCEPSIDHIDGLEHSESQIGVDINNVMLKWILIVSYGFISWTWVLTWGMTLLLVWHVINKLDIDREIYVYMC